MITQVPHCWRLTAAESESQGERSRRRHHRHLRVRLAGECPV